MDQFEHDILADAHNIYKDQDWHKGYFILDYGYSYLIAEKPIYRIDIKVDKEKATIDVVMSRHKLDDETRKDLMQWSEPIPLNDPDIDITKQIDLCVQHLINSAAVNRIPKIPISTDEDWIHG